MSVSDALMSYESSSDESEQAILEQPKPSLAAKKKVIAKPAIIKLQLEKRSKAKQKKREEQRAMTKWPRPLGLTTATVRK